MFEQNLINMYGAAAKTWLQNLPVLIDRFAHEYGLTDLKPVDNLSFNYVLTGFQRQKPIVVKLGLDLTGLKQEAITLQAFSGFGAIQVLAQQQGFLLLERAVTGISLKSYFPDQDTEATRITAGLIAQLHKAPLSRPIAINTFPHLKEWLVALDTEHSTISGHYLKKARQLRDVLLQSSSSLVLLHGDLHHENILQNGEDWVVIDPKGVIGDPVYEVAAFIRNPIPDLLTKKIDPLAIINRRIQEFANFLGIDKNRIQDWCFVQSVLSWVWAIEDGSDSDYFEKISKIFDEIS